MKGAKIFAKLGWLVVVIGFFMPISCNQNGVGLSKYMFDMESYIYAICTIAVLIIAAIAFFGIISLLSGKNSPNDFCFLILDVACGLIPYFKFLDEVELEKGGVMIIVGWAIVLLGSIVAIFTSNHKKQDMSS